MRIAVVHGFYRSDAPSGENRIVERQVAAMRDRGLDVHLVSAASDDLPGGPVALARTALQVARFGGVDLTAELDRLRPDVVHVHNTFPTISARALAARPGPLVVTVHNYRPLCARAVLFRDGAVCTLCPDTSSVAGVRHRCYRDSAVATVPLAVRTRHGVTGDPLLRRADRIVLLSEPARRRYAHYGLAGAQVAVVPNGVADPGAGTPAPAHADFAAVGRLSPEKGFADLVRSWPAGHRLQVYGSGEQEGYLRSVAAPGVTFHGALPPNELQARLRACAAVVVPGVNPEGAYPLVVVEAWALGRPVVARAGGTAAGMVADWGGGTTYGSSGAADDLAEALARVRTVPSPRPLYEQRFTEDAWIDGLLAVYRSAAGPPAHPRIAG